MLFRSGKFIDQGEVKISEGVEYSSHNTSQLDVEGMQNLLMKLGFIQATLHGEHVAPEE